MKNIFLQKMPSTLRMAAAACMLLAPAFAWAQVETPYLGGDQPLVPGAEFAPGVSAPVASTGSPEALFDIQFAYNATDSVGRTGMAAVAFHNNEFWVSRWASDTLYKFSLSGQYLSTVVIPGLTGVRSFASDGTYLYAGTNTATIYRIDPNTATLAPPHITAAAAAGTVRHCSYDPTLNGNAGGFWVGNFNTDLFALSMTGSLLSTIPAATHGLSGMYGSAYDPYSTGGPYLWVFAQMAPSNSMLYRVELATGTASPFSHDVMTDIGVNFGLTSGLAGGLFISNQIVGGQNTIVGMIQGTPSNILFGYELSDPVIPDYDAEISAIRPVEGYTQIPLSQIFPESFEVTYKNMGQNTLDTIFVDFEVKVGVSTVFTDTQFATNVAPAGNGTVLSTTFLPANGVATYDVTATARTVASQVDSNATNDAVAVSFQVTDTTYARDNNVPDGGGGYSVNAGTDYCWVTSNYTLFAPETVTAIWIKVASAVTGDTTRAVVANTISGTNPDLILTQGSSVILAQGTTEYLLPIPGGFSLAAGTYSFGCYQAMNKTIKLAQTPDIYTANTNFFKVGGGAWNLSSIQTARFIRPVFGTPVGVSNEEGMQSAFELYPNPTEGVFSVVFPGAAPESVNVLVTDAMGKVVKQQQFAQTSIGTLDLSGLAAGVYFVSVQTETNTSVRRLMISK